MSGVFVAGSFGPKRRKKRKGSGESSQSECSVMSEASSNLCPACGQGGTVKRHFTWRGIISAIFCFPCGIWCCLRRKINMQCERCGVDVIRHSHDERSVLMRHGYKFKEYESTRLPPGSAYFYRNAALSVTSQTSAQSNETSASHTPLIRKQPGQK